MKTITSNILDSFKEIVLKVTDGFWLGVGFSVGVIWFFKTFTDFVR